MTNGLLHSWERRSRCQNNFGNAVPRRSRWKLSLNNNVVLHSWIKQYSCVRHSIACMHTDKQTDRQTDIQSKWTINTARVPSFSVITS